MIKKIILILFLLAAITACGKKGDPEYKAINKKIKIPTILINKTS